MYVDRKLNKRIVIVSTKKLEEVSPSALVLASIDQKMHIGKSIPRYSKENSRKKESSKFPFAILDAPAAPASLPERDDSRASSKKNRI